MKTLIINQYMGLGDILFIIPICEHYYKNGYKIIFPVNKEFVNLNRNFENITFVDKDLINIDYNSDKIVENDNFLILPIRFSNNILSNGDSRFCMSDKYKFLNLNLNMWKTLKWKRNKDYENELYFDILKLNDGEKYNLINVNFSMNKKIDIKINNEYKNVYINYYDKFNLLDWYKVLENATTIHTVGTSINYIMEVIPLKANELHLYKRPTEMNFDYYLYLFEKKYILHY